MKRRKSSVIAEEMEALRSELLELEAVEEPNDEQVARASEALGEFEELSTEHTAATAHERRIDAVRSASLDPARQESGDGATADRGADRTDRQVNRPGAPEVMRRVDPYEGLDLVRAGVVTGDEMVSRARTAIETAPQHMSDAGRQRATELVEMDNVHAPMIARHMLLTGSKRYHDEFREYIATQGLVVGEAMRTALSLTNGNGGFLVPFTLDPTIILTNSGIAGPIRSIATIKTIATDDWNGVTSAGVTAEWLGEGTEAADATPTFTQPTITTRKAAAWVFGSYEVLADSGFATELGRLLADAKVRLEEAAFANGNTGASKPRGVIAAVAAVTASIVSSASVNALVAGDVYNVASALRPRDAERASWAANKSIMNKIRQFDTAGGSAFWANLGMSTPPQLLGQPIYQCSTMQSAVTTSGLVLLAGNFEQYYVVDRVGMSVLYEPIVKGTNQRPTGQAGWFAFWRVGADVVDADAFRLLQLHTSPAFVALA